MSWNILSSLFGSTRGHQLNTVVDNTLPEIATSALPSSNVVGTVLSIVKTAAADKIAAATPTAPAGGGAVSVGATTITEEQATEELIADLNEGALWLTKEAEADGIKVNSLIPAAAKVLIPLVVPFIVREEYQNIAPVLNLVNTVQQQEYGQNSQAQAAKLAGTTAA